MDRRVVLPRPQGDLSVEGVHFGFSTRGKLVLRGVTFELAAGEALGIVGPSGAGKSVLARHVVGTLQPTLGVVRLDGADVSLWPHEALGQHLGYLPQDIELFAGTVAANISRFQPGRDDDVIRAANLAGVHEMILKLPKGYDTEIGDGGLALSGGYRQRIALARAVFGSPSLVVLDEPSSNLDATGDSALSDCVLELKRQATTLIVISHRPATLANVDKVLVLRDGMVEGFGPRADMISRLTRPTPVDIGPRRTSETVAHSAAVGAA
jgi:ABC-type protease/lipase transport system fused ATPase/permease subunit